MRIAVVCDIAGHRVDWRDGLVASVGAVQDVVLNHEQDVEENGEEAETKLGRVVEDGVPVI